MELVFSLLWSIPRVNSHGVILDREVVFECKSPQTDLTITVGKIFGAYTAGLSLITKNYGHSWAPSLYGKLFPNVETLVEYHIKMLLKSGEESINKATIQKAYQSWQKEISST